MFECDFYVDMGLDYIYPQRKNEWKNYVRACCASDKNFLKDFFCATKIMQNLENGVECDVVVDFLNQQTDIDLAVVLKTVLLFSKRGPEFYRMAKSPLLNSAEKYVKAIESQNAQFEKELSEQLEK